MLLTFSIHQVVGSHKGEKCLFTNMSESGQAWWGFRCQGGWLLILGTGSFTRNAPNLLEA